MANIRTSGHGGPEGNCGRWVGDHTGPKSYVQWAAPNTGGDVVTAVSLGLRSLDFLDLMGISASGLYIVTAKLSVTKGGRGNTAILVWYPIATFGTTQVAATTNLSGETVRMMAIGG
jgi:hypothetical protein